MPSTERRRPRRRQINTGMAVECGNFHIDQLTHRRTKMSDLEHSSKHAAKTADKTGGCGGGAHDHECDEPELATAAHDRKPAETEHGSHTHASRATGGSCGCGGKHK